MNSPLSKDLFMDEELDEDFSDDLYGDDDLVFPHQHDLVVLTPFGFWGTLVLAAIGATTVIRLTGRAIKKLLNSGA